MSRDQTWEDGSVESEFRPFSANGEFWANGNFIQVPSGHAISHGYITLQNPLWRYRMPFNKINKMGRFTLFQQRNALTQQLIVESRGYWQAQAPDQCCPILYVSPSKPKTCPLWLIRGRSHFGVYLPSRRKNMAVYLDFITIPTGIATSATSRAIKPASSQCVWNRTATE